MKATLQSQLPPGRLAAHQGNRDMAHCRIGLGAVPMPLTRLDLYDVSRIDFALLTLGCHHAGA